MAPMNGPNTGMTLVIPITKLIRIAYSIPIIFISHDEQLIEHSANTIIHVEQLIRKTKSKITISRLCYKEYLDSRNLSFLHQTQIAKKERSEYKKKRERLLQLFEKARNNGGWRNSDGTPSSDGHAKRSMQAMRIFGL